MPTLVDDGEVITGIGFRKEIFINLTVVGPQHGWSALVYEVSEMIICTRPATVKRIGF